MYSDKSESSVDEMMGDTPSNYNIPNMRLDGKSLGLKAILLQAQKNGNELPIDMKLPGGLSSIPEHQRFASNPANAMVMREIRERHGEEAYRRACRAFGVPLGEG